MARTFRVTVTDASGNEAAIVVPTIRQAAGLVTQNAMAGREITVTPCRDEPTHKNTYHAQAVIDMVMMGNPVSVPEQPQIALAFNH